MANADCNTEEPPNPVRSPSISKRKKAFRFVPSSDIMLLKETLKHRPWAASHGETLSAWSSVATGLKAALTSCTADGKACRRRFNTLLEYNEHAQVKADKTEKEKREAERRELASAEVVQSAMEGLRRSRSESSENELSTPPPNKKKKKSSTEALVEFLDTKAEARISREKQKERQLDLQERRLALEEQRLQQDRDKLDKLMGMMASQMGLMSKLIEKMNQ
ncbi:hypothetical protein PInf_004616 [Phytophthora infestans]|nr:hypothetical protein PInf_004616 [Phytophthora infestans]